MQAAVDAAKEADGGLRISDCCAGTGWAQKIAGSKGPHPLMPFETIIAINLIGTFNVLRLAATAMLENEPGEDGERGVCVNTASIAAFDGQIGQIAYSASKGGVVGMTLPAARDLSRSGIRVVTIAPGLFDTPLLAALPEEAREALGKTMPFPQRLGFPEEYALAGDPRRRQPRCSTARSSASTARCAWRPGRAARGASSRPAAAGRSAGRGPGCCPDPSRARSGHTARRASPARPPARRRGRRARRRTARIRPAR